MKNKLFRIGPTCAFIMLLFASAGAHAFCTEIDIAGIGVNCRDEGHKRVTGYIEPVLRQSVWNEVWDGNYHQDRFKSEAAADGQRHFESCRFATDGDKPGSADYIQMVYRAAINKLDPASPDPAEAAYNFGNLLHTVQDFYAHTNWINLLNLTGPAVAHPSDLLDRTLGVYPSLSPLSSVRDGDNIIVGQIPSGGLPAVAGDLTVNSAHQDLTSETPIFATNGGDHRGLITGWNASGACPDVRPDTTVDGYSHFSLYSNEALPRTNRLTHGESKIAGLDDVPGAYQEDRPCHDGYPTSVCLQKDTPDRPDYEQAIKLAAWQTAHEYCRMLHLAKDSRFGYPAASILMTLWAKPHGEAVGPDPITLGACATPAEAIAGKAGPIEVTVDPGTVAVNASSLPLQVHRKLVFALYTGDLRRSTSSDFSGGLGDSSIATAPKTMCVNATDKLVATVWGWDDFFDLDGRDFGGHDDRVLRGETLIMDGPGFQPVQNDPAGRELHADFQVTVGGADPDGDGLTSACGETYYGTSPTNPDSDGDGLNDGAEVNTHRTDPLDDDSDDDGLNDGDEVLTYGTDPQDTDSDDDGLTDGAEISTHGTNPANADSDGDGLNDGDEVNTHKTDPNDNDTDNDGLSDGIEVKYGTNPLLYDSDGDGLPDGRDVEWIQRVIAGIPDVAIKSPAAGNRNAMLNLLNDAEALLLKGNRKAALSKLVALRSRIDGCGAVCDGNDWIVDCAIQTEIRMLVDLLIANASA
jgi:hypothetical protein